MIGQNMRVNGSPWKSATYLIYSVVLAAILSACSNGFNGVGSFDSKAKQEATACPLPRSGKPVAPPSGTYVDHGIRIEYTRLAPDRNPFQADQAYVLHVINTPDVLEQLYFDATQGNHIAAWSVCVSEVSSRFSGRAAARKLASLSCQTVSNCRYDLDRLPFSPDTASGARILTFIAEELETEATRLRIRDEFISHALSLYVGARIASRAGKVARRSPPSLQSHSKDSVWSMPPAPRGLEIEKRLGGNLPPEFKTIDRWNHGIATSIKSIDLRASAYRNPDILRSTLKRYTDAVARFQGSGHIAAQQIRQRVLEVAIPAAGTVGQQAVLKETISYGQSVRVTVKVIIIP